MSSNPTLTLQKYVADVLILFVLDPPDTEFKRGYESAFREIAQLLKEGYFTSLGLVSLDNMTDEIETG
jgi:hypothetical protein